MFGPMAKQGKGQSGKVWTFPGNIEPPPSLTHTVSVSYVIYIFYVQIQVFFKFCINQTIACGW